MDVKTSLHWCSVRISLALKVQQIRFSPDFPRLNPKVPTWYPCSRQPQGYNLPFQYRNPLSYPLYPSYTQIITQHQYHATTTCTFILEHKEPLSTRLLDCYSTLSLFLHPSLSLTLPLSLSPPTQRPVRTRSSSPDQAPSKYVFFFELHNMLNFQLWLLSLTV